MTQADNDALHGFADQAGRHAADTVGQAWSELWAIMLPGPLAAAANYHRALQVLTPLPQRLHRVLGAGVASLLVWAHGQAGHELMRRLPAAAMQRLANARLPFTRLSTNPLLERAYAGIQAARTQDLLHTLLFPPLPFETVHSFLAAIMPPADWSQIGETQGGPSPAALAGMIADRYAAGESTRNVAAAVLPHFNGSRVRAQRAARTFGAYVGTKATLEASEQLGDLVVGYEVIDPGGPTARKDHTKRSGTKYWRNPGPGQLGFDVMPHPPLDRGGPNEDGTGVKWNCRCYLNPILAAE